MKQNGKSSNVKPVYAHLVKEKRVGSHQRQVAFFNTLPPYNSIIIPLLFQMNKSDNEIRELKRTVMIRCLPLYFGELRQCLYREVLIYLLYYCVPGSPFRSKTGPV